MAEKTFTTTEVAEILELIAIAIEQGAKAVSAMLDVVPELAKAEPPQKWIQLLADTNAEQLRSMVAMVKEEK